MPRRACYSRTCADITNFWSTVSSKRSRCRQSTVVDCQVVDPPSNPLDISDHRTVVVFFEVNDRLPYRHPWRVDDRLLNDETAKASWHNRSTASIGNHIVGALSSRRGGKSVPTRTQPPGPKALNPTPFYRHVIGIYRRIVALNLDTPLLEIRNTELAQELLVNSGCEAKNPEFPWILLTFSWLPGSIQGMLWRFGWSVLPTANRTDDVQMASRLLGAVRAVQRAEG
ncbi:hypothetical protein HPB51_028148 [Rhipicephalus microplus]|uniref:Uncharacterized protein n=1 Tax=Rhipicephalus microplus TaxID=6941 RepID=A0A9J6CY26_RHIMP|nr:hypothetical protein HPB51_028148 [Rhipicephalus microplus]